MENNIIKRSILKQFAFIGTDEFFNNKLNDLSKIAEKEEWTSPNSVRPLNRLYQYIIKTFEFALKQELITYSQDKSKCIVNTGLLTEYGCEDIYMYFEANTFIATNDTEPQPWKFIDFSKSSSRKITDNFTKKPDVVKYVQDYNDLYFDTNKDIDFNYDHIIMDHWSEEMTRFPKKLQRLGLRVTISLIKDAFELAKVRIKRNNRLVVPQYYNDEIMYLIPLKIAISDKEYETMALAVEKTDTGNYRVNTIFTLDMAYMKARLLMKPEVTWLNAK